MRRLRHMAYNGPARRHPLLAQENRTMTFIDPSATSQRAQSLSSQLGNLAGELAARRDSTPVTDVPAPETISPRLSVLLDLLRRQQRRQHAAEQLRSLEFAKCP